DASSSTRRPKNSSRRRHRSKPPRSSAASSPFEATLEIRVMHKMSLAWAALAAIFAAAPATAESKSIVVASTTSTEQSGMFNHILPLFEAKTGIKVRVVAQGTGQALDTGRRGDADVVFVHDREAELKFVAEGFGVERREVMYNDFVVVGPAA